MCPGMSENDPGYDNALFQQKRVQPSKEKKIKREI